MMSNSGNMYITARDSYSMETAQCTVAEMLIFQNFSVCILVAKVKQQDLLPAQFLKYLMIFRKAQG